MKWIRHIKVNSTSWWAWVILAALLLTGTFGVEAARYLALAIAGSRAWLALARRGSLIDFPAQVRVAYLAWMGISFIPAMVPMLWIQAVGTLSLVLMGYCPLARMLLFLPVNRSVPLTLKRTLRIVLHPPTTGSALRDIRL